MMTTTRQAVRELQREMEGNDDDEADKQRRAERERKKAEVRKRLEDAGRVKKAKKGFLTSERKMKLRATEDLKLQHQRKAEERQRVLGERIPELPSLDSLHRDELLELAKEYKERILKLECEVYDLSYIVRQKDFEINEITIAVNDLRGKFVKPSLKRISKTDTQFDKMKKQNEAKIIEKIDYRSTLKPRMNTDGKFALDEEKIYDKPPEWAETRHQQQSMRNEVEQPIKPE